MIYDCSSEADGDKKNDRKNEGEKEGQLERHKWWQTEEALSTHAHTHIHKYTHTTHWVSNQTEAGRTAKGENEFCSLEAWKERETQEGRKRKEGKMEGK